MENNSRAEQRHEIQNELAAFLKKGFLQWQQVVGERRTYIEFAEWIGISGPQMNQYIKGTRIPSPETARFIADHLGPRIFDILGIQPPDEDLKYVISRWDGLSAEQKNQILIIVKEAVPHKPEISIRYGDKVYLVDYKLMVRSNLDGV